MGIRRMMTSKATWKQLLTVCSFSLLYRLAMGRVITFQMAPGGSNAKMVAWKQSLDVLRHSTFEPTHDEIRDTLSEDEEADDIDDVVVLLRDGNTTVECENRAFYDPETQNCQHIS